MSLYYANVTGLRSKTTRLFNGSADASFDVVCLTETWLCGGISDAELFNPDYLVFRRDRHGSSLDSSVGGGVLCAIRRCIPCRSVAVPRCDDLELLCSALMLPQKCIFVVVVYIPPRSAPAIYERLAACIESITGSMHPRDEMLLFGDFNLPSVDWLPSLDDYDLSPVFTTAPQYAVSFIEGLLSSGLSQSTTICNDNGRFLDLIFSTDPTNVSVRRCQTPLVPETGHHPALHVIVSLDTSLPNCSVPLDFCYNFKKADFSHLNSLLANCDWSSVLDERDIDCAIRSFYVILSHCFLHCVPICKAGGTRSYPPWFNDELRNLKNRKSKAWKKFCDSRSDVDYESYSSLRSEFVSHLETLYSLYLENIRLSLRDDPKRFWSFVNSKRKSDGYPSSFSFGDIVSDDPQMISDLFGDFFATAFLADDCDTPNCDLSSSFSHLTKLSPTSLSFNDLFIDEALLLKRISSIADSFSPGPDGVPAAFVKRCGVSLAPILCYLFNLSLSSGIFPKTWKLSHIVPLHKKGPIFNISNYRPIANLCCLAKIFESLICDTLSFHCKPFLQSFQHGFLGGKSTSTNLLDFSNFCLSNIEYGKQIDCIFTDFSKAFDRINHRILLLKLSMLGFPSLFVQWLCSYLSGRSQRVSFRGALSKEIFNLSGVPQGSHLGPLLFIIFINDVSLVLSNARILCYADDAKIFRVVSSEYDCSLLNSDLSAFSSWCKLNQLPLNIDKCTYMHFTRSNTVISFNYTIDGCSLQKLDSVKDLGVWFNSQFSFNIHIDTIISKANSTLGFVKRWSKEFNDPYVTRILYCTFVRPILEYACLVWSPSCRTQVRRLEAVQKRFLRFALRDLPWTNPFVLPPYEDRLKLLSLQTLETRRINAQVVFAMDCMLGRINSPEIVSFFSVTVPARSLREHSFFHVPFHRTNYGMSEPITSMSRASNHVFHVLDFNLTRSELKNRLRWG